jgi:hypothetical protein
MHSAVPILQHPGIHNIRTLGRISNLLHNPPNLLDRLLFHTILHPLRPPNLAYELLFNIGHNLVPEPLRFLGECLLHEKPTQNPGQAGVDVVDAGAPPLRDGVGVAA